jgi:hypothetical protein
MPDSARTKKRAGSAPERAGVMEAPKSPASVVRSAVKIGSRMRTAFALHVTLRERVAISVNVAAMARRCAWSGSVMALPARHQDSVKYAVTPMTPANETIV